MLLIRRNEVFSYLSKLITCSNTVYRIKAEFSFLAQPLTGYDLKLPNLGRRTFILRIKNTRLLNESVTCNNLGNYCLGITHRGYFRSSIPLNLFIYSKNKEKLMVVKR
jgi:hypothetical protein